MLNKKEFGLRLREVRKASDEQQKDLADFLDISTAQVSDMENGKKTTTLERLVLICEHYNVSSDYLLGLSDAP
ncbi:MAG: helix-turn-helix transcriptional regulator [Oscillospiraceae bacterium]|jgi:transcriptional regulator with XRE-family HTH domain|nr:helix-turn-helix transcriptional regulator [Oscillospiraceae bacterium]